MLSQFVLRTFLFPGFAAAALLLASACGKDDAPAGSGSSTGTTSGTTAGTTSGAITDNFRIGASHATATVVSCRQSTGGFYSVLATGPSQDSVQLTFRSKPTTPDTFQVYNSFGGSQLMPNQVVVGAYQHAGYNQYMGTGGSVVVSFSGNRLKVSFGSVPVKELYSTGSTTVSGTLTCN